MYFIVNLIPIRRAQAIPHQKRCCLFFKKKIILKRKKVASEWTRGAAVGLERGSRCRVSVNTFPSPSSYQHRVSTPWPTAWQNGSDSTTPSKLADLNLFKSSPYFQNKSGTRVYKYFLVELNLPKKYNRH